MTFIESFINDLITFIAMAGFLMGMVFYLIGAAVSALARHCYRDYRKQGGAPALAKKAAAQTAAHVLKQAVKSRFK